MRQFKNREVTDSTVKDYFQKIHSYYQESIEKKNIANLHIRIKKEIEPQLKGRVLDIGSGGITQYENKDIQTLISVDNVFEFLKKSKSENIFNVAGDIRAIPFKDKALDCIVIQFVVHHLGENCLHKNLDNVERAVSETSRVLKGGGRVYVVDGMVPIFLEKLERLGYRFTYRALKLMGKPMVFMVSVKYFLGLLRKYNLNPEKIMTIDWGGMTEFSQALFPWLRLPLKYSPFRCALISAIRV